MQMTFAASSGLGSPILTHASASATGIESHGSTVRLVESSASTFDLAKTWLSNTDTGVSTPLSSRETPTPAIPSKSPAQAPPPRHHTPQQNWTPKSSLTFRSKEKRAPHTPPNRPRGRTVPLDAKPQMPDLERERDRDTDSVLSFTPSTGGKNLANWFSGLLGR